MTEQTVTLDRAQRAAVRAEMELAASGWGDFAIGVRNGERDYVLKSIRRLRRIVDVLDAVGWGEQPATPDLLPVTCSRSVAAFARSEAESLRVSVGECDPSGPSDQNLDAYSALRAIGAA
jgi:hypothetical protein